MNDNNIDPNKIIRAFTDCQGTCKTPIGCTCGKRPNASLEEELWMEEKNVQVKQEVSILVEEVGVENESAAADSKSCCCKQKRKERSSQCCWGTHKLEVYDWLQDYSDLITESNLVEVQFKNTRKGYYINSNNVELYKGDIVAVEASPGHDIGEVTLTGKLVELQMKKVNFRGDLRRVYRIAKGNDMEKYEQAKAKEHKTMLRAREIAEELQLDMKISDVEFQGDGNKAIFYYIADGRVDFRQLIKYYASEFRVKIEMKQIGARQEAGRVGGIGPCGRELCCSSSMSNFVSVSTSAARIQDIPLNPQKLAGQCGKLKCCLNFETDVYVEAQKKLPSRDTILETKDSLYYHFKTDVLSGCMTYSTDKHFAANLVTLPSQKVFDVIRQNRRGEKPLNLIDHSVVPVEEKKSHDVLEQESISRFDDKDNGGNGNDRRRRKKGKNGGNGDGVRTGERGDRNNRERKSNGNDRPKHNKEVSANSKDVVKPLNNRPNPRVEEGSGDQTKDSKRPQRRNNRRPQRRDNPNHRDQNNNGKESPNSEN